MKVAVVLSSFPQRSETFIVNKIAGLLGKGVRVDVICGAFDRQVWGSFPQLWGGGARRPAIRVVWPARPQWLALLLSPLSLARITFANPAGTLRYIARGWKLFGADIFRRLYLDAEFLAARPDLVHFEFGTLAASRMYLRELLNCRVVVSFRGFDLNFAGLSTPEYYSDVWKSADVIHCLGRDLWARARRRGCPGGKPKALIAPAIDTAVFRPVPRFTPPVLGTRERPLRILSVGRLEWKKGHEFALEAVRLLRLRGLAVRFRIVGEGDHLEALAFCRRQLGLDDCVLLMGALPPQKVLRQMHWADVFLHAAVSEGFCNAVVEAQAAGLPVVTSDADGLPENVEDGVTGFVVPRRDPRAMADRLEWLAGDPQLRMAMGHAGPARVQRLFRLESQIEAFAQLYERTCALPLSHALAN